MKQIVFLSCLGIASLGISMFGLTSAINAQQQVSGCCQFEGDEPGCWYPSDSDSCANLNGVYIEDSKNCDLDTGYCEGYKKSGDAPAKPAE